MLNIKMILTSIKDSAPFATLLSYHFISLFRTQDTQNQLNRIEQELQNLRQQNKLLVQKLLENKSKMYFR